MEPERENSCGVFARVVCKKLNSYEDAHIAVVIDRNMLANKLVSAGD